MVDPDVEGLAERLRELERAMDRHLERLEALRNEIGGRAAYIDARFSRAEEVLRSIGRPSQESL